MLWVPTVRLAVAHVAMRELPDPVSATALQPEIEVPPSVKLTVPVGLVPVTVAVKVTFAPTVDGLAELANAVLLVAAVTTCDNALLVEVLFVVSPP